MAFRKDKQSGQISKMSVFKKIIRFPFIAINMAVSLLLIFSCYGSMAAPIGRWPFAALSGLAFPFLFIATIVFLVLWLITWKKGALISVVTILICIGPILRYCPLNLSKSDDAPDLTVLTFNTESFGYDNNGDASASNPLLQHVTSLGAQILLFQEARTSVLNDIDRNMELNGEYPYRFTDKNHMQACISKYPIISHETIPFNKAAGGNSCLYLRLLVEGDTLAVFNCHLQSNSLVQEDFDEYHHFIENPSDSILYAGSKKILGKLLKSTGLRATQAELVREKAQAETAKYMIVCGDFNDTPLSYSFHVFDRFLTDVYGTVGRGPGITYHEHRLFYRIDHMFCNSALTPISSNVDRGNKDSDHYPVISRFKLNK